ncbi:MAG: hypothetical protein J1E98_08505 [Lachnospiraceae bacterium]|nr:hypothetical protein [Lachnospiraceae bacterium]
MKRKESLYMKYTIPFHLRNKENILTIDYREISSAAESGFSALKLPFDVNECVGNPMLHAYFENLNLNGYERYCGFIQVIKREEYPSINDEVPAKVVYELDASEEMQEHKWPYFAYGYPAEFFDAPCHNLNNNEKILWRAYTYLVDIPSRMNNNQLLFLAGFSWGYIENIKGEVQLLDFEELSENDWLEHQKYMI